MVVSATAWIALLAVVFTGTQAWIALRKLRLDLFDKRFQAYEAINTAINDRRGEMSSRSPSAPFEPDIEKLRQIWTLQRQMQVLFPIDVSDCLKNIKDALVVVDEKHLEWVILARVSMYADPQELRIKHAAFLDADRQLRSHQDELATLTHRYIRQYGWVEVAGVYGRRWASQRVARFKEWRGRVQR
jgi:hypothetical protein